MVQFLDAASSQVGSTASYGTKFARDKFRASRAHDDTPCFFFDLPVASNSSGVLDDVWWKQSAG